MRIRFDFLRPSPFLNYPILLYATFVGVVDGVFQLWHGDGQTHDYALAYGMSAGLSVVLGLLLGMRMFYWINALFIRYLKKISAYLDSTEELMGSPSQTDETLASGTVSKLFRAMTWCHILLSSGGSAYFCVSLCFLLIRLAIGFPDWTAELRSLFVGSSIMASGIVVGLLQSAWLDYRARKLRRIAVARLGEERVSGTFSDGAAVVATMQEGEKWVGNLTGVRGGVLTTP